MKRLIGRNLIMAAFISLAVLTALCFDTAAWAEDAAVPPEAKEFLNKMSAALDEVAAVARPSVVNISTTTMVKMEDHPFGNFFDDPFFRRFFGDKSEPSIPKKFKSSALGSGVIVSADGNILTNFHVVKGAEEIKVILFDKREFKGKVVGSDPQTDIAVVKINAEDLIAIKMGESGKLKTGDVVLAIGNPFGLNQTVTMGIVSAVGRSNVGISDYEDFIQTDAAINPGNSGGALVNTDGELVGINTAIFSTSGGYMGIGFAIPSDMANTVAQSILKHGKVIRGWLGVSIQELTPELAKDFDIKHGKGVLVSDVVANSPAGKAGFKRGDVIVEFDGKPADNPSGLRNMVAATLPGKAVKVRIVRHGREEVLPVTIEERHEVKMAHKGERENVLKGVEVQDLTPELRGTLNIPVDVKGVLVVNVGEDSPAYGVLARNDVIEEINRKPVDGLGDYMKIISSIGKGETVLLLVYRNGGHAYITIRKSGE